MGGRNNSLYKKLNNIALNDLCLYNLEKLEWETIALYGILPPSRWGHSMVSIEDNKLIVFGGVNTNTYMNSNIYLFEFGDDAVDQF
jgi:N-acetylneuraminic acid mutarotase